MRTQLRAHPHAAHAIARNNPATGLASPQHNAHTIAIVRRLCRNASKAASAKVTPKPNVTRPTMRFVTVATANHSEPNHAAEPNSSRSNRSNKMAEITPHSAPSATGPVSAPSTGDSTL